MMLDTSMVGRILTGALLIAATAATASAQDEAWLPKLTAWLEAVDRHEPGTEDQPALAINAWPRHELAALVPYITALAELLNHPDDLRVRKPARVFSRREIQQLVVLALAEGKRGDRTRVMKRGALLHTDIAMLLEAPQSAALPPPPPIDRSSARGRRAALGPSLYVMSLDGRFERFESPTVHWDLARGLLDFVIGDPAGDEMVCLWYRATSAFLEGRREYAVVRPHLERARQLFPTDAELLFFSGALDEALASPDIQTVVQTTVLPGGLKINVSRPGLHLAHAERFFRRALEINPALVEARLRLGRTLGQRGEHEEALRELEQARVASTEPLLAYYADLFLAAEERALGRHAAARTSYERARARYPLAQSPHLGLSQLARERGDVADAHRSIQHVLAMSPDESRGRDPWWTYYTAQSRHLEALLANLRKPFVREPAR
jgi:Tfp pilus assembly protein PilF